jgi:hypothetical protein
LQVRELSGSLAAAQQQLSAAQSAQAADAATAEQRLKLLQQQLTAAEAGLMRRMTGGWFTSAVCTVVFDYDVDQPISDSVGQQADVD